MNRKWIIGLAVIVALAAGIFSAIEFIPAGLAESVVRKAESLGQPPQLPPRAPRPVALYTVQRSTAQQSRVYPGVTAASSEVELAFRVAGPLVAVNVGPGDVVEKGAAVMQIDPRDYEDRIAVLEAQLAGARAGLEKVRLDFERTKPLKRQNVVSQADYDSAKTAYDTAAATVQRLAAELRVARHALEDTTLRAPFEGIVTAQLLENHEMVAAGQKALKMQDISKVEIHVHIPENELKHYDLRPGQSVQAAFPAIGTGSFQAQLREWSAEADPQTRTYEVVFVLDAPRDATILPGMTAEVRWQGRTQKQSPLAVPVSAIASSDDGGSMVWVYDEAAGTASPRSIETGGLLDGAHMSVLQGLAPGETIVAAGVDFITPEMRLRPLEKDAP